MCCCCTVAPDGRVGGQYGLRIPLGAIFTGTIQIDVEAYLAFCKMGIGFISWDLSLTTPTSFYHRGRLWLEPGLVEPMARVRDFLGTRHSLLSHFLILLRDRPIYCEEYVCAGYIHICDCVEILCGLPLLQNNTASETFIQKSGAVRSVVRILSLELQLGSKRPNTRYWTNVLQSSFQTVNISNPSYFLIFFLITFLEQA